MRKCFGIAFLRCVIDGDTWIDRHFHKEIRKLQEGTFGKKSTLSIVCVPAYFVNESCSAVHKTNKQ